MKALGIINPLLEAIEYFRYKANGVSTEKVINRLLAQREIERGELERILRPALELEACLDRYIVTPPNCEKYFSDFERAGGAGVIKSCCAMLTMLFSDCPDYTDMETLRKGLLSRSREEIRTNFIKELGSHIVVDDTEDSASQGVDYFLRFVEDMPLSEHSKWQIICAYNRFEEYVNEISAVLEPAVELIIEKKHLYEPYLEGFDREYSDVSDILDNIKNLIGTYFIIEDHGLVYPKILANSEFTWIYRKPEEGGPVVYIGIGVRPMFEVPYKVQATVNCEEVLKVLGDRNRLAIMRMLKSRSAYGQEIADMQGLSPNTISHHMNKLQACNLTQSTVEGSKVYYASNQKTVIALIEQLKDMLVEETRND